MKSDRIKHRAADDLPPCVFCCSGVIWINAISVCSDALYTVADIIRDFVLVDAEDK